MVSPNVHKSPSKRPTNYWLYVRPFVKSNKNDMNDAEGITEAASRPNMRFVPIKQLSQQDIQSLHRIRQRLITNRSNLSKTNSH